MTQFFPGTPAREKFFYNRNTQVNTILRGGWAWICGQRRMGKTSLLYRVEDEASKQGWQVFFLDLSPLLYSLKGFEQ